MNIKRTRAFLIDFLILLIIYNIINIAFPNSKNVKRLKIEQNEILESYTSKEIRFTTYLKNYSIVSKELDKERIIPSLIYLVFICLYFIVLPYKWKGRTIGSYINGIQIERFDRGKLHIKQLFIRSLIVIGLGYLVLSNILVFILPSKYYFMVKSIIGIFQIVIGIFSAYMILFTKEKRGIQDLISNTEMAKIIK